MAHKVQTMAYTHEKPWHGLGNEVTAGASVDTWLREASLDWGVETVAASYRYGPDRRQVTSRHFNFLVRSDTGDEFDVVGPCYVPFQNTEILDFFREYVDAGEMDIETAGALNGGRDIWALAKMHDTFKLPGKDVVEGYVLLMNSHRYGRGGVVKFTGVRVVCWNTLTSALRSGARGVKLWHVRKFDETVREEAKVRLGIARDQLKALRHDATTLTGIALKPKVALQVAAELMGGDPKEPDVAQQNPRTRRVMELFDGAGLGADMPSAKGTAWGLLNAVTQYVDHEHGRSPNNRLTYAWLYGGETLKERARVRLLELAR